MRWTAQWASIWINDDAPAVTNRVSARNNLDVLYFVPLARKLIMPLNEFEKAVLEQMLRQASGNLLPLLRKQIKGASVVKPQEYRCGFFFTELKVKQVSKSIEGRSSKMRVQISKVSTNPFYFYCSCGTA